YKQIYERLMSEKYSESNIQRIIEAKTTQEIDDFVEDFKKSVKNQTQTEDGFPKTSYRVSKAAEIALTLLHHRMYGNKITINACCPGYVNTDMTGNKGPLTIQEGADTPSYLAIDPEVPKGKFVFLRQIIDWY
uniref:Carbonyl reductase n=1 Tax=Panagrolaimus sp. JU765 TaxID=591449 RepID=A0AC34RQ41_9BILA